VATPVDNYEFAFNGWLFGGPGQGVQVLSVEGLEDLPQLRVQDDTRGFQDGMFTGRDFLSGRTVVFTLQIMNDSNASMQTYLAEVKSNLQFQQSGTGVLQMLLPGRAVQRLTARVRRRAITIDPEYSYGKALATVEFFCPDPRIYDDSQILIGLNPTSQVGRVYDRTYDLVYTSPSGSTSSFATATNSGNVTVFPVITLTGAMTYPIVVNSTTGQSIPINLIMSAADTLVIDPDLRSVVYNGLPARNLISNAAQWFGFPPGNTTIGIIAASADVSAQCQITYRNGYV
jgi:hypothetical protein